MKKLVMLLGIALLWSACESQKKASTEDLDTNQQPKVQLIEHSEEQKVNVVIEGKLFTSYIYPEKLKKPILYPILTSKGTDITRGFPLFTRPGERMDHPHHVGLWFNYGDVNGLDFWNNSYKIPEESKYKYGTIRHQKVIDSESGEEGKLSTLSHWLSPDGKVLLEETTVFKFTGDGEKRIIDRISTLTANEDIKFTDNKEGMLAIRVRRELELPSDKPAILSDLYGNSTQKPILDKSKTTGDYLNSEGITGNDVWGKRAVWTKLFGNIKGESTAISIIDHPQNPGYPTYWHARGYGLFAANTLGQKAFSKGENELNFSLKSGESATFRYRIIVATDQELSNDYLNAQASSFGESL